MKSKVWLPLLSAAFLLTACVQYASGYKRQGRGGGGGGGETADAGGGDTGGETEDTGDGGEDTSGDAGAGDEGGGDAGGGGGVALLDTCGTCHGEGLPGAAVVLNSAAIPRLNEAHTGKNKDNHKTVESKFVEPDRAALEAELSAISLRLRK